MVAESNSRHHMIDGQLEPNQVLSPAVTAAMGTVAREAFVPPSYRHAAYIDDLIPLERDRYLAPPLLLGQLLEALDPQPNHNVFVMASGTGYGAALLYHLGCRVQMLEETQDIANKARQIFNQLGYGKIEVHAGSFHLGFPSAGPYDRILVEGGVQKRPASWADQLMPDGGRLVYVEIDTVLPIAHRGRGFIKSVIREEDRLIEETQEHVAAPILPGTEQKEGFYFG